MAGNKVSHKMEIMKVVFPRPSHYQSLLSQIARLLENLNLEVNFIQKKIKPMFGQKNNTNKNLI